MFKLVLSFVSILFLVHLIEVYSQTTSRHGSNAKIKHPFLKNPVKNDIKEEILDMPAEKLPSSYDVQQDQSNFVERKVLEEGILPDRELIEDSLESCQVTFNVPISSRCSVGNLFEGQISSMQEVLHYIRANTKFSRRRVDSAEMLTSKLRFANEGNRPSLIESTDQANEVSQTISGNQQSNYHDPHITSEAATTLQSLSEEFRIMMTNLEIQIEEADVKRRKLEAGYLNLTGLLRSKQSEINNQSQQIEILLIENIQMQSVLTDYQKQNHVLHVNNQLLIEQQSDLEIAKQTLEEKYLAQSSENDRLNNELSAIRNEVKVLRHEQVINEKRIVNASERISELKSTIEQMQKKAYTKTACASYNSLSSIDALEEIIPNHTHCGVLTNVSEPHTIRQSRKPILHRVGVWMKDSEASIQSTKVWSINQSGVRVRKLYQYANLSAFQNHFMEKVYSLPVPVESNGAVMYNGSLYFQRRNSRRIVRFKLANRNRVTDRSIRHAGFHGMFAYQWGGFTDIDFAVDETGLWVIYSTPKARGNIIVSKIDPHSLQIIKTIKTPIPKRKVSNAFIICQVLYTVSGFRTAHSSINYSFDLNAKTWKKLNIPFENNYQFNTMVDYNPADRYIYAWDNGRQVRYKVTLDNSFGEIRTLAPLS